MHAAAEGAGDCAGLRARPRKDTPKPSRGKSVCKPSHFRLRIKKGALQIERSATRPFAVERRSETASRHCGTSRDLRATGKRGLLCI